MADDKRTLGMVIAGGALSMSLLDTLHDKGILTLDEARGVLDRALKTVGTHTQAEGGYEAAGIITSMMSGRFSARR